jgi:Zn-dependent peptidase ImmA (M78 family)
VLVHRTELDDGAHGWWCPDERVILLDRRLTRVETRCTLAHELEHMLAGDAACHYLWQAEWFSRRQEFHAEARAARKLLPREELAAVLALDMPWAQAAAELDVTEHLLRFRLDHLHPSDTGYIARRLAAKGEVA